MATLSCPTCAAPYQPGDLICLDCGANLARVGRRQPPTREEGRGGPPAQPQPQPPLRPPYEAPRHPQDPQYQYPQEPQEPQYGAGPRYQQDPPQHQHQQPEAAPPPYAQQGQGQQPYQPPYPDFPEQQPPQGQRPQHQQAQPQQAEPWFPQEPPPPPTPRFEPSPPQEPQGRHQQPQHQQPDPPADPRHPGQGMDGPQHHEAYPPPRDAYAPPQDAYAPPRHDAYAPPREDAYAPPREDAYAPPRQVGYAPPGRDAYAPPARHQTPEPPGVRREETLVPPEEQLPPQQQPPYDATAFMCPHCEAVLSDPSAAQCGSCLRPLRQAPLVLRLTFPTGEVKISLGQHLVLGRDIGQSPVATTFTQYDNVSRRHSTVWLDPSGTAWVRDERSTNGTFVNGERLPPGVEAPLHDGDTIRLAADATATVSLG